MSLARLQATVAAIVQALVGRRLDYACLYPATVIGQAGDGSLELLADDPLVRGTGARAVQVRHGLVGSQQTVPVGARCVLAFAAADPARPFVVAWDRSATATRGAARLDDTTNNGTLSGTAPAGGGPVTFTWADPDGVPFVGPVVGLWGKVNSASAVTRLD